MRKCICGICGAEFETTNAQKRYCGKDCARKSYNAYVKKCKEEKAQPKVKKVCPVCGKEFETTITSRRVYCGENCRNEFHKTHPKKKVTEKYTKKNRPMTPALKKFFTKFARLLGSE